MDALPILHLMSLSKRPACLAIPSWNALLCGVVWGEGGFFPHLIWSEFVLAFWLDPLGVGWGFWAYLAFMGPWWGLGDAQSGIDWH